jgi:putative chitinase
MGNRPGTNDGSMYIGRGGPQITGRGGYQQVGDRCRLDLVNHLELATAPENQPAILAAFWTWKDLNQWADDEDFKGCVKAWNGGTNGMRDRLEQMRGNDPVIGRLGRVSSVVPALNGS